MRGRLRLFEDGVELHGWWRTKRFVWTDILVFRIREYTARSSNYSPFYFTPRPTTWLVTQAHEWHHILGIRSEDQMKELNEAMDEGWTKGRVDMARFAASEWNKMRGTESVLERVKPSP